MSALIGSEVHKEIEMSVGNVIHWDVQFYDFLRRAVLKQLGERLYTMDSLVVTIKSERGGVL